MRISASEIGKFAYCPLAWYLERKGFLRPSEEEVLNGKRAHETLARRVKLSRFLAKVSVVLLVLALTLAVLTALR